MFLPKSTLTKLSSPTPVYDCPRWCFFVQWAFEGESRITTTGTSSLASLPSGSMYQPGARTLNFLRCVLRPPSKATPHSKSPKSISKTLQRWASHLLLPSKIWYVPSCKGIKSYDIILGRRWNSICRGKKYDQDSRWGTECQQQGDCIRYFVQRGVRFACMHYLLPTNW